MTHPRRRLRSQIAVVFVVVFVVRFLAFRFYNDHFEHLSIAVQMLGGELPGRDFADMGRPLKYLLSAAAQLLLGRNLLSEALLVSALLAAGAALTFWAAVRASGSRVLGWYAALLVLGVFTREYGYPKIILPAVGLAVLWRYVDDPRPRRLVVLAGFTVVAFLIRHDYGFYLAVVSGIAIVGTMWSSGLRAVGRASTTYGLVGLALVSPYLLYLGVAGGVGAASGPGLQELVSSATVSVPTFHLPFPPTLVTTEAILGIPINVRWVPDTTAEVRAAKEAVHRLAVGKQVGPRVWAYELPDPSTANLLALVNDPSVEDTGGFDRSSLLFDEPWLRLWLRRFGIPRIHILPQLFTLSNTEAILYYLLLLLPVVSLVVLLMPGVTPICFPNSFASPRLKILLVAVLGVLLNLFLIRGNIDSRLGDVIVPPAVLAAWLFGLVSGAGRVATAEGAQPEARRMRVGPVTIPVPGLAGWRRVTAVACAGLLGLWVVLYGDAVNRLLGADLFAGPVGTVVGLRDRVERWRRDPIENLAPEGSQGSKESLIRYVRRCTDPSDRVLAIAYLPEVFYASRRRFGGGMVVFVHRLRSPDIQRLTIERLQRQSVPLVIINESERESFEEKFPLVNDYLHATYEPVRTLEFPDGGGRFTVLTHPAAVATGVYEPLELPCFGG